MGREVGSHSSLFQDLGSEELPKSCGNLLELL
jgi:hypothetical protein